MHLINKAFLLLVALWSASVGANELDPPLNKLSLPVCIETALKNHRTLAVSDAAVAMAEAQYQQAMSAYWPRISVDVQAQRTDQDRTFSFQGTVQLPNQISQALTGLAAQNNPQYAQALQAGLAQPISSLPMNLDVKLYDRDLLMSSVNLTYPIFTGGKITALRQQAEKGVSIAQQVRRKSELEVIRDVKRYYYGAQFAQQMEQLADETLEHFKVLDELTERLYKNGSLKVKKTDYLRAKTTTAMTRSLFEEAQYAREMALQALVNAMGLNWDSKVTLSTALQPAEIPPELTTLINAAQQFNPEIQQLNLAIQAAEYKMSEAYSGYYPVIGFQASAYNVQNDYHSGLTNTANRDGWTLGLGLQWNLFDGFETASKVNYANAMKKQLTDQQILLDQGMALQIKQHFLRLKSASQQLKSTEEASGYAAENRQLQARAYQEELVETKDVIESQIMETFAKSAAYRSRHELYLAMTQLEYLVGTNIKELN